MLKQDLTRRRFLSHTAVSAVGATAATLTANRLIYAAGVENKRANSSNTSLFDKIYGCLAGSRIGSAMGAAVEGWDMDKIANKYGIFDKLVAYHHYNVDWDHPAGST